MSVCTDPRNCPDCEHSEQCNPTGPIDPIIRQESQEMESSTVVEVFDRFSMEGEVTIRQLLKRNYGLDWDNHANNPDNEERSRYVGSGCWCHAKPDKERKHRDLRIWVSVGCGCSHDCCGHLCGLEYSITINDRFLTVITSMRFNY